MFNLTFNLPNYSKERILVEKYQSGNKWYNLYSDGWLEQGGIYGPNLSSMQDISISLNIAFSNTNYVCIVTGEIQGASGYDTAHIVNTVTPLKATNSFGVNDYDVNSGTKDTTLSWYACGYTNVPTTKTTNNYIIKY